MGVDDGDKFKAVIKIREGENIFAIDPGETSGLCYVCNDVPYFDIVKYGPELYAILDKIPKMNISVIVCEDYKLYPGMENRLTMDNFIAPKIIGAVEYLCHIARIPLKLQMAAHVKPFWTDARLKEFGYWTSNKHKRDSARHALNFLWEK